MEIRSEGRPSREEWDWIWRGCGWATAFQSPGWADLWARVPAAGLRPRPRRIEFEDGAVAILPLSTTRLSRGWLARRGMPLGTFGGWIARMPLAADHVGAIARRLRGGVGELDFRLSPYVPYADHPDLPRSGWDETLAVDLRLGFDAVFRDWSKGHQGALRQAEREGVRVARATSIGEWRAYHEIHQRSQARRGEGVQADHGWPLFADLARSDPRDARLWLARVGEQIVGGAVCLYARRHVSCWHAATDEPFATSQPLFLLVHRAMRDAAERGLDWYDFNLGPIDGMGTGAGERLVHIKRGFGARALRVPILRHHTRRARVAARTRRWLERAGAGA